MPLVPPYIEALRPYEAGRSIEEIQRAYGLSRVSKRSFRTSSDFRQLLIFECIQRLTVETVRVAIDDLHVAAVDC